MQHLISQTQKIKKISTDTFFKVQLIVALLFDATELKDASVVKMVEFDIDNNFVAEEALVAVVIVLDT